MIVNLCFTDMGNTLVQWRACIGSWAKRNIQTTCNICKQSCSSPWFMLLVLAVLLVIGGVEMNPGPNQVSATNRNIQTTCNICKQSCSSPWFMLLVLAVLLIIGGVEMNPGPNQVSETIRNIQTSFNRCKESCS